MPQEEEGDSLSGLGGYHGSVQTSGKTIYYAVGVYSEEANGKQDQWHQGVRCAWKNIVATFVTSSTRRAPTRMSSR